ncbi:uncharacterized protein EV420DRAFT_1480010 [Desarmillaria tabescens]|uniref:Uncharacterized protein n=1 Tax=Armillaria tabescens TaxID=1929756 RepID=A0AA39KEE5_ARMTA|nr:uncharacterized protein EV420DRAFT_1480010 [Desarmillaria tabescens]KAK0458274.1 hypothetical protein EV420DRAFT_1480010 [Desarmillaria tabescens]
MSGNVSNSTPEGEAVKQLHAYMRTSVFVVGLIIMMLRRPLDEGGPQSPYRFLWQPGKVELKCRFWANLKVDTNGICCAMMTFAWEDLILELPDQYTTRPINRGAGRRMSERHDNAALCCPAKYGTIQASSMGQILAGDQGPRKRIVLQETSTGRILLMDARLVIQIAEARGWYVRRC